MLFARLRAQSVVPASVLPGHPSHMLLFTLVAFATLRTDSPPDYQVLTKDGATCAAGTEITSVELCSAAIDAANKALGKPGIGSVDTVSLGVRPKGCYTIAYSDSYGYSLGYFNTDEIGSGAGTDTGDNRYVHCLAD